MTTHKEYLISTIVQNPYGKEYELTTNVEVWSVPGNNSDPSDIDYWGHYDSNMDWDQMVVLDLDDIEKPDSVSLEEALVDLGIDCNDLYEKFEREAINRYIQDESEDLDIMGFEDMFYD